jgi:hypothetical protein
MYMDDFTCWTDFIVNKPQGASTCASSKKTAVHCIWQELNTNVQSLWKLTTVTAAATGIIFIPLSKKGVAIVSL